MKRLICLLFLCNACAGATLPWEDGSDDEASNGTPVPLPGWPPVSTPLIAMPGIDGNLAPSSGIAIGGHALVTYDTQEPATVVPATDGPFTVSSAPGAQVDVVATGAGSGDLLLDATYAGGETTADESLVAVAVADVAIGIPGYHALAALPTTFLGPHLVGDVRLLDAAGRDLTDTSLHASGTGLVAESWDTFDLTATGAATVHVSGSSIGELAVPIAIVDHFDSISFTDTGFDPPATYYHTICAHGMASGVEVAATWSFAVVGAEAWNVTTAPRPGNCADIQPGTKGTAITATAPDGETLTMTL